MHYFFSIQVLVFIKLDQSSTSVNLCHKFDNGAVISLSTSHVLEIDEDKWHILHDFSQDK